MTRPVAKNLDDSFATIYEALELWASSQRCIRGHVYLVRDEVRRLEEELKAKEETSDRQTE